jgi:hypothetical protein
MQARWLDAAKRDRRELIMPMMLIGPMIMTYRHIRFIGHTTVAAGKIVRELTDTEELDELL